MRFQRKEPAIIEAIQYDGTSESCEKIRTLDAGASRFVRKKDSIIILRNGKFVEIGDWVVKEGGSLSVYQSDQFEIAFDRIEDPETFSVRHNLVTKTK